MFLPYIESKGYIMRRFHFIIIILINFLFIRFGYCEIEVFVDRGGSVSIPIVLNDYIDQLKSFSIIIKYDHSKLKPLNTSLIGGILADENDNSMYDVMENFENDCIDLGIWTGDDFNSGKGIIATLNLKIIGDTYSKTTISIEEFICNEKSANGFYKIDNKDVTKITFNIQSPCDIANKNKADIQDAIYMLKNISENHDISNEECGFSLQSLINILKILTGVFPENDPPAHSTNRKKKSIDEIALISLNKEDTIKVPIRIDQTMFMSGIDIKAHFSGNVIDIVDLGIEGGILKDKGYDFMQNLSIPGTAILNIFTYSDIFEGKGEIAFFDIKATGNECRSTMITLDEFICDEKKAYGGFVIDNKTYSTIQISIPGCSYAISSTSEENGSITPAGELVVKEFSDKFFNIIPDHGYIIDDVIVDGISVGGVVSYSFTDITENHSIKALFKPIYYKVNGTVSYTGTQVGNLHVQLVDYSYSEHIIDEKIYSWDSITTNCSFQLSAPIGKYNIFAYIDSLNGNDNVPDPAEAKGSYSYEDLIITTDNHTIQRNFNIHDPDTQYQIIYTNPNLNAQAGKIFKMHLNYKTSDLNPYADGLQFSVHYNSNFFQFDDLIFCVCDESASYTLKDESTDESDGDETTDKIIEIVWSNNKWPGVSLPTKLCTLNFNTNNTLNIGNTTSLRFFSNKIDDQAYKFKSIPANFTVSSFHLDIDGNGKVDALTDGLLVICYLFQVNSPENIERTVDKMFGTRTVKNDIDSYLNDGKNLLDIDCNGEIDALTDGILILRYLFGIDQGAPLLDNAVDLVNGLCTSENEIINNINELLLP